MFVRQLLTAVMAVALTGCVSPLVKPDAPAWQHRAGDASDWQVMARETVAAIPLASSGQSYNVYVESDGSAFSDAYKAYLEEALFNRGFPVARTPETANISITYEVLPFYYEPGGKKRLIDYFTVSAVAAAGLAQFRDISSLDTGLGAGVVTGAAADYIAAVNGATNAEVVVTSKITSAQTNNFHFVRSQTFYVRPADLPFYVAPPPGYPVIPLRISSR